MAELPFADRVAKATVRMQRFGGQGVLVPGGYVLTAAHCIDWQAEGHSETIEGHDGEQYHVTACAVEAVADLAVLAALDEQAFSQECERFERFYRATDPVPLSERGLALGFRESLRIHVLTHKGKWIKGSATRWAPDHAPCGLITLATSASIQSGTSGSPVVDDAGDLVGVVSSSGGRDAMIPLLCWALPRWAWERIRLAQAPIVA
jgi:S1-C subfamily serine protease